MGVARQAILDSQGRVFGYELLCRADTRDQAWHGPLDHASARVIDESLLTLGLGTLTGNRKAFVNASQGVLVSGGLSLLPANRVVIEILEHVTVDSHVLEACRTLRRAGYVIALDDFAAGSQAEQLLEFASFVKVDIQATPLGELQPLVTRLRKAGHRVVAEKVETRADLQRAQRAGCTLFQGYFFCRPETFAVRALSTRAVSSLRLLAALHNANVTVGQLEQIIKQDPAISYRVLRAVNGAGFGLRRQVQSIGEGVFLLGLDQIRRWAAIWALAGLNAQSPELVTMTIVRARCCELLGSSIGSPQGGAEFFLLGLCSLLDVILERPMAAVIADLPLSDDTRMALLGGDVAARYVLDAVTQYERGHWTEAEQTAATVGLTPQHLADAQGGALRWASEIATDAA